MATSKKEYRALFISDVHLSNRLPHAKPLPDSDVTDRFAQQLQIMEAVGDRADMEGIQDIYILGDLFDKPVLDTVTLRESTKCLINLAKNGTRVFVGAGNHEAPTVRGGNFVSEFIQPLPLSNIIYMTHGVDIEPAGFPLRFYWVPWGPEPEAKERIEEIQGAATKWGGQAVLLCHQSVDGCTAGGWKCDDGLDPDWLTESFSAVLSGHFHDPQTFGDGGMYLGSPLQLHYGDAGGDRQYWDVTFKKGKDAQVVPCATDHAKFYQHEVDGPEGIKATGEERNGDFVRFIVKCSPEEWTKNHIAIEKATTEVAATGGCYAKAIHRPVATGSVRLGAEAESMAYEEMLTEYVKATKPEGLDEAWLNRIGREALEAARAAETAEA